MIVEKILETKAKRIKQYPVKSNRASEIGIPCVRYHVLNRTRWQEKALHGVETQGIFDLGNDFEQIVMRELAEAGIQVIEQQRSFEWKEHNITGHIDGKALIDGAVYPFDVKSSSPYVFKSINTINDLLNGKYGYLRKYPTQLNLYLLMGEHSRGFFLFKDKVSGAYKEIWMDVDYDLGEETLQRAEAINRHVADGTLPEPINEPMWCDTCGYAHICLPEQIGRDVEIDTTELAEWLDKLESLKPAVREYEEIDEMVKRTVVGREKILAGEWFVTGKWQERKGYDLPDEIKQKYQTVSRFWRRNVKKVGGGA